MKELLEEYIKKAQELAHAIIDDKIWDNTEGLHGFPIDYNKLEALIIHAIHVAQQEAFDDHDFRTDYNSY